ncbi:recombinase family protein [Vibrio rarus]|uniref:recombinase family protein n=1 Tax=Vibrio rarus TaxID=413403 RepID=UPI0021C3008F|nr:recombinase family protein [Vibrio rarus]
MKIIYARVSTQEQNIEQQVKELESRHGKADTVFVDKASGKDTNREQLQYMLSSLRSGDVVIAYDVSRIGRDVSDVLSIAKQIDEAGASLVISQLGGVDVCSPSGKIVLATLGAVAEMERKNMLEKQAIGIARAKEEGKYKGKQISDASWSEFNKVNELIELGMSQSKAIATVGMNKSKFYRLKKC